MRHLPLLLALSLAACTRTTPCEDADGDGVCAQEDCDDSDAALSTLDLDQDGQSTCDGDCDDADPAVDTLDADDDGSTTCDATPDCDDTDPLVHPLDEDNDGVSTCDVVPDCDDGSAARSPLLTEVCGDGIDNDCSGFDNDQDADGDGDSAPSCGGTDCDDRDPRVSGEGVEDCTDGLDNDCSGLADDADLEACDCPDSDGDGYRCDDVDDVSPDCGAVRTDVDLDGVCADNDVDDRNPECGRTDIDTDDDGYCVDLDADDANPNCFTTGIDEDDDGFCVETDTNDRNPTCTTSEDSDSDGVCDEQDSAPNDPLCFSSTTDSDGDGYCAETDSDDTNAGCQTSTVDADGDGVCDDNDCDDTALTGAACSEGCDTWFGDADNDGYASTDTSSVGCQPAPNWRLTVAEEDCNDSARAINPADADGDGVSTCDVDPDCDDADDTAFPGATEVCDGVDNDCTDAIDDGFEDADMDGADDCEDACPLDLPPVGQSVTVTYMGFACSYRKTTLPNGQVFCGSEAPTTPVSMPTVSINGQVLGTLPSSELGCYGAQGQRPPVSATFDIPEGLWTDGTTPDDIQLSGMAQTPIGDCDSVPSGTQKLQMTGWISADVDFADDADTLNRCLYGSCGSSYGTANTAACGRPRHFFGGQSGIPNTTCPTDLSARVFPFSINDDSDNDGTPNACDDCPDDGSASPNFAELCDNGVDDDCDGNTDATDDDCCNGVDTTVDETGLCGDTVDNDCDGLAEGLDPDCAGSACDIGVLLPQLAVRSVPSTAEGDAETCDAGPAPGICETDATTAMAWLSVPVVDPDNLGWRLEICAPDASAVIHQDDACTDGECLPRSLGCYSLTGVGTQTETFGIGSTGGSCTVPFIASLTLDGGER